MRASAVLAIVTCGLVGACVDEPRYLQPTSNLESATDADGEAIVSKSSLTLPIRRETDAERMARGQRAQELGVDVPFVKLNDLLVEVEYHIKNLDAEAGVAKLGMNGANERFAYDNVELAIEVDDDELIPPPLAGDIPVTIPGNGELTGSFREDQLLEAAIDCEQVTRGNLNPFAALLSVHEDITAFQPVTPFDPADPDAEPTPMGPPIPREAFAGLVRIDMTFTATTHMVADYQVRVRDVRGLLPDELLDAPGNEVTHFDPAVYSYAP